MITPSKTTMALAATIVSAALLNGQVVLKIDFETADTSPSGNWNSIASPGTTTNLVDFNTGLATSVSISLTGDIADSSSTGQWGTRSNSPSWADALALSDRFFISEGNSGTLTIAGLTPGISYDIELAASYGGGGTSGNDFGQYELTDADGLVEGFNALTMGSLGTTVMWEPRLAADSGSPDGVEGWLGWYGAVANPAGELTVALSAPAGANPRIALNAMQLTAVPEPATVTLVIGFVALGGVLLRRRKR